MTAAAWNAAAVPGSAMLPPMLGDPCPRGTWFAGGGSRSPQNRSIAYDGRFSSKVGGLSQSSSSPQLRRRVQASMPLPPIMRQKKPVTFEDIYKESHKRVAKKCAHERKGGTSPKLSRGLSLPDFPGGGSSGALKRPGSKPQSSQGDAEAQLWAAQALSLVNGEQELQEKAEAEEKARKEKEEAENSVMVTRNTKSRRASLGVPGSLVQRHSIRSQMTLEGIADPDPVVTSEGAHMGESPGGQGFNPKLDPELLDLLDTVVARNEGTVEGFSEKEYARMEDAYNRFKVPGEADLHSDDLCDLLKYLGHILNDKETVLNLLRQVTMYDDLDFDEFVTFMELFMAHEREVLQERYKEFDYDSNGEMSVKELRNLMKSLGLTPLRQMVEEAREIVDLNANGELSFNELCLFFAVYQHNEGFTHQEVKDLKHQFDFFSVDGSVIHANEAVMPPDSFSDAMVQFFGLQVSDHTTELGDLLAVGQGRGRTDDVGGEPQYLKFREFMIYARQVREHELSRCRAQHPVFMDPQHPRSPREIRRMSEFDRAAAHASQPKIRKADLLGILESKDYTPLKSVIDEIVVEVCHGDWEELQELDPEEFFDFMLVLARRDGFLKKEVKELQAVYARFDEDGSGEVSAMECSSLFRHIGYRVTLDDIRDEVAKVDVNGSGQLDFREFMRLMRLYREKDLARMKQVFHHYASSKSETLDAEALIKAMTYLGHDMEAEHPPAKNKEVWDFDDLVALVDSHRSDFVMKERKKAAFSDQELENFQDLFYTFDRNKNNEIDVMELQMMLETFGWQPKTRDEQEVLMTKIELARANAREAGVDDVQPAGSATIHFWTFVQLLRILRSEADKREEEALVALQKELAFSDGEVEEFRQVFRSWAKMARELAGIPDPKPTGVPVVEKLSRDTLRRLVRSLGVSISLKNEVVLDEKIQSLDEESRKERAELNFNAFLKLMRWILDTDFAGVHAAAAPKPAASPNKEAEFRSEGVET